MADNGGHDASNAGGVELVHQDNRRDRVRASDADEEPSARLLCALRVAEKGKGGGGQSRKS